MGIESLRVRALLGLGAITMIAAPALTQVRGAPTVLAKLEPGQWQLRDLDSPRAPPRSVCLANPEALIQIEHPGAPCSRLVLSNDVRHVEVHSTCPSNGFGRTTVRFETSRLAKIDTQGIIGNAPFALRAEARRVGTCPQSR